MEKWYYFPIQTTQMFNLILHGFGFGTVQELSPLLAGWLGFCMAGLRVWHPPGAGLPTLCEGKLLKW